MRSQDLSYKESIVSCSKELQCRSRRHFYEEKNPPSIFLHENMLFPSVPNEINYALDERVTISLKDFPKEFKNVPWF